MYKVEWTSKAIKTYVSITDYIFKAWSGKEVKDFENKVEKVLDALEYHPQGFAASRKRTGVRKIIVTKQTSLAYRVKGKTVELLSFLDNRRNPKTQRY